MEMLWKMGKLAICPGIQLSVLENIFSAMLKANKLVKVKACNYTTISPPSPGHRKCSGNVLKNNILKGVGTLKMLTQLQKYV